MYSIPNRDTQSCPAIICASKINSTCKLLVEVVQEKLVFHKAILEEAFLKISNIGENLPEACDIISIVSRRQSGKPKIVQNIVKCIKHTFQVGMDLPSTVGDMKTNGEGEAKARADAGGISFQFFSSHVQKRCVILMDIVGDNLDSTIYTRLVNFCLLTSSFVFYVEDSNQNPTVTDWSLELSSSLLDHTNLSAFILIYGAGAAETGGRKLLAQFPGQEGKLKHREFIKNLAAHSAYSLYFLPQLQTEHSGVSTDDLDKFQTLSLLHLEGVVCECLSIFNTLPPVGGSPKASNSVPEATLTTQIEGAIAILNGFKNGEPMEIDERDSQGSPPPPEGLKTTPLYKFTGAEDNSGSEEHTKIAPNLASPPYSTASNGTTPQNSSNGETADNTKADPQKLATDTDKRKNGRSSNTSKKTHSKSTPNVSSTKFTNFDSQAAAKIAIHKYRTFMEFKLQQDIFTDLEISEFHNKAWDCIISDHICPDLTNKSQINYVLEIKKILPELLKNYQLQNAQAIRGQVKARELVLQESIQIYKQVLDEYLNTVGVNPHLPRLKATAQEFAATVYKDKCRGISLSTTHWMAMVNSELENYSLEGGGDCAEGTIDIHLLGHGKFIDKLHVVQRSASPVALALHLSPSLFRGMTLIRNGGTSGVTVRNWPFFIAFEGARTIIGDEASKSMNKLDLYKYLTGNRKVQSDVKIRGKEVKLHIEEVIAMFLFKLRREIYTSYGVPIDSSSSVLTISPFLSTTARQRLKTSLLLAGFKGVRLIHSNTSIGLFYYFKSIDTTPNIEKSSHGLLSMHVRPDEGLEVSLLLVNTADSSVNVISVSRTSDVTPSNVVHVIKKVAKKCKDSAIQLDKIIPIIVAEGKTTQLGIDQIHKDLNWISWKLGFCVDETEGILSGAWRYAVDLHLRNIKIKQISTCTLSFSAKTSPKAPLSQEKVIILKGDNLEEKKAVVQKLARDRKYTFVEKRWEGGDIAVAHIEANQQTLSIQILISSDGLFHITSSDMDKIKFASDYLTPNEVAQSSEKLTKSYFKEKDYFTESWNSFLESMKEFYRNDKSYSNSNPLSLQPQHLGDSDLANLENLKAELKHYIEKVESRLSNEDGTTNVRIIEKVTEDVEHCRNFLLNFPKAQAKDVARLLERLLISASHLNIV